MIYAVIKKISENHKNQRLSASKFAFLKSIRTYKYKLQNNNNQTASKLDMPKLIHHGGTLGVTGSCHQLIVNGNVSLMIDCGLFQGADAAPLSFNLTSIPAISALVITHSHIDHIGRLPYLLAAGYRGSILCSEPTSILLPIVIEDALKIGFTRNQRLIRKFMKLVDGLVIPLPYNKWHTVNEQLCVKLKPAGHILGSAYVEVDASSERGGTKKRVVFSGDMGAPYTPLLPSPSSPYKADWLILESTYGDREHEKRRERRKVLEKMLRRAIADNGTILIPAFSLGRTQELLYELDIILSRLHRKGTFDPLSGLDVVIDSPLAARFTEVYRSLESFWDAEAKKRLRYGDHPLIFKQLRGIESHNAHLSIVKARVKSHKPAIIIAASGMCSGGRIMNYLKALLADPRTDIFLVGYQASGTPGRIIKKYGPQHGYVNIDGRRYNIKANVESLSGYSAHADRSDLINFVKRMRHLPERIILTHGEPSARSGLAKALITLGYSKVLRKDGVTELGKKENNQ